jgi:hypothetical protein
LADAERVVEESDHPFFFLLGVTMFVIGASALFLWLAKNTNQTGLVRLIQQG